jgi:hypothetical protein
MEQKVTQEEIDEIAKSISASMKNLEAAKKIDLDDIYPPQEEFHRQNIRDNGITHEVNDVGERMTSAVTADKHGYIWSTAAKVNRKPQKSYDYIKTVSDYSLIGTESREEKIDLFHKIYSVEGFISNAINASAALVSAEGNFYVRRAKSGNRKSSKVKDELQIILDHWKRNVNARNDEGPVTSASGLSSIISQGARQALIEGSWIGYLNDFKVNVPNLGRKYLLPMYVQSLTTKNITVPDALQGTGLEEFLWEVPKEIIQQIEKNKDDRIKDTLNKAFPKEMLAEIKKYGNIHLQRDRIWHVKHRGMDTSVFGESFIEPIVGDLAYKRSLQALDFVTIESMINRILILKVGSDNPDSQYHNLEAAHMRLQTLKKLYNTTDPSMTILWAGPDIDVLDVGVHDKIAELDGRWKIAMERILYSMGVPKSLLIGEGGGGQVWAGYEGYKETLRAMQNAFAQSLSAIGERIAEQNGFDGVEVSFIFNRSVLADQTANANLALNARRAGLGSLRTTIPALGGDFETERRNRILEMGLDPDSDTLPPDDVIFSVPMGMPGDTRTDEEGNLVDPGRDPEAGRPTNKETTSTQPERAPQRNPRDGE